MAKHVLYSDIDSTRKQPYLKKTHQHYNEMIDELTKAFGETIVSDSSVISILWGCVNSGTGTGIGDSAIISAGAVYYNGEIYQVPAFTTASIVNGLKGTITISYTSADPVTFSDNSTHNVHEIKTIVISDEASVDLYAYSNWYSIKNTWNYYTLTNADLETMIGDFNVDTATDKELRYKIDYKTQTATLNFRISGANLSASTPQLFIKLPNSLLCSSSFTNVGYFINDNDTATESAGYTKETSVVIYTNGVHGSGWLTIIPTRSAFYNFDATGTDNIYLNGQITFSFGA
jgi:hypothetical protein